MFGDWSQQECGSDSRSIYGTEQNQFADLQFVAAETSDSLTLNVKLIISVCALAYFGDQFLNTKMYKMNK